MSSPHRCSVCGGERFEDRKVLWPELIAAWSLSPEQAAYIDRQQGRTCLNCGTAWRSMALAAAIMQEFEFRGLFQDFVTDHRWETLAVLEINAAGQLSRFLEQFPGHQRADYPEVDMQCMPMDDNRFDLVIHSDTLEHIPDPLKSLQECCRVLRPGGRCLYTVPIIPDRLSRSRDGLPPSYHGNGSNPEDYRVFTEFGADCWTYPLSAGFQSCRIHAWEFPAALAMCAQVGPIKHSQAQRSARSGEQANNIRPDEHAISYDREQSVLAESVPCATGERLLPTMDGPIVVEHLHRYSIAVKWATGQDVLDIACGEGYGSHLLSAVANSVVGIDIDAETVRRAAAKYGHERLTFTAGDCRHIPLPDQSIDLAVSFETIEHIAEHKAFLRELRRVLRPDGVLLISTPNSDVYHAGEPPNPYHIKELSTVEFVALLRMEFQQVSLAFQETRAGSLVIPDNPTTQARSFSFQKGDFTGFQQPEDLASATYLLAAASNGSELPPWPWGSFSVPRIIDFGTMLRLQTELDALLSSTSWRTTAPLRWIRNLAQRISNRLLKRSS